MTIDTLKGEELPVLWNWLVEDVPANFDDFGPKTFEQFLEYVNGSENLTVFAFRTGQKLVGAAGFDSSTKYFKGIVFSPEVRGSGVPVTAIRALLLMFWKLGLTLVHAKYFITNKRVPGFFRKLGAKFEGLDGHTTQGGVPVAYVKVSFQAPTEADETPAVEIAHS